MNNMNNNMSFSVEVEMESFLFENLPERMQEKEVRMKPLHWDIKVQVEQKEQKSEEVHMKKLSSTSALLDRMARGRKVSRQGEWVVFTEKTGLLTTQAGTQQVSEQRVKLDPRDLNTLKELGF